MNTGLSLKSILKIAVATIVFLFAMKAVMWQLPEDPQHPMYGLKLFVPAHDTLYQTSTDW